MCENESTIDRKSKDEIGGDPPTSGETKLIRNLIYLSSLLREKGGLLYIPTTFLISFCREE